MTREVLQLKKYFARNDVHGSAEATTTVEKALDDELVKSIVRSKVCA